MRFTPFEETPENNLVRGLLAIKEKYHCSWNELMNLSIPTVIEMWKTMEKEAKEFERQTNKLKSKKKV